MTLRSRFGAMYSCSELPYDRNRKDIGTYIATPLVFSF